MKKRIRFETTRLKVEGWGSRVERDALVSELENILTPAVLEHLPEPLQLVDSRRNLQQWIEARAAESKVLTVRMRNGKLIGLLILAFSPKTEHPTTVHLGYLLSEVAWGKGYGTELVSGLVSWFGSANKAVQLLGGVGKQNKGSARVLINNGFEVLEDHVDPETDIYGLRISGGTRLGS